MMTQCAMNTLHIRFKVNENKNNKKSSSFCVCAGFVGMNMMYVELKSFTIVIIYALIYFQDIRAYSTHTKWKHDQFSWNMLQFHQAQAKHKDVQKWMDADNDSSE